MDERDYSIALNMVEGLGSLRLAQLIRVFGSAGKVAAAGDSGWRQHGIGEAGVRRAMAGCIAAPEFRAEMQRIEQQKVPVLTLDDPEYPDMLRQIYDPPVVLYVRGNVSLLAMPGVGVVGCRRASWYGLQQAGRLASGLARRGVCVISGLARGIDTAAHKGALEGGGITVAVLGSGLDRVYPPENKVLAERIALQGALITEFPLDTPPLAGNFPRRNRIISGLSRAIVVVEAAARSGSLITANLALEQGRDVFAVPGQAGSATAQGTNQLIKDGAKLVETADDIWEELGMTAAAPQPEEVASGAVDAGLDDVSRQVLAKLSHTPLYIDTVIQLSAHPAAVVYQRLLELQLRGLVKEVEGKRFVRV